jgi:hypothetical protein
MNRFLVALFVLLLAVSVTFAQNAAPEAVPDKKDRGTPVIAAWDVVPHQVIDKPFNVGVVAFHEKPIGVVFMVVQPPLSPETRSLLVARLAETAGQEGDKGNIDIVITGQLLVPHITILDTPTDPERLDIMLRGTVHISLRMKSKGDANENAKHAEADLVVKQLHVVKSPKFNERTGVWEFHTTVEPSKLNDGPFEVYALPGVRGSNKEPPDDKRQEGEQKGLAEAIGDGLVRILSSDLKPLPLHANAGGTLKFNPPIWADCGGGSDEMGEGTEEKPFKAIKRALKAAGDGGAIYLKAGKGYSAKGLGGGKKRTYWTTITAAPGVKRDDVEIGPGRTGTDKLRFKNVALYGDPPKRGYNTILAGENGSTIVWVDECKMYNRKGRWGGGGNAFGNRYVGYVTGGITTEMDNGPGGVLVRNHKIHKITSDALTNARTAINCEVRDIDPGKTGAHPDWHQSYTGGKDKKTGKLKYKTCIIYNCSGLSCQSQGFFGHNLKDSAFVNCIFHKLPGHALSQYSGHMDHVLWLHCTVPNQSWLWRGTLRGDNCHVVNGLFLNMQEAQGGDVSGFAIGHNHFITPGRSLGEAKTTGDAQFVDADKLDFHVKATSPAARSGKPLQCVPADIDGKRRDAKSPTRGCYVCPEPKSQE